MVLDGGRDPLFPLPNGVGRNHMLSDLLSMLSSPYSLHHFTGTSHQMGITVSSMLCVGGLKHKLLTILYSTVLQL